MSYILSLSALHAALQAKKTMQCKESKIPIMIETRCADQSVYGQEPKSPPWHNATARIWHSRTNLQLYKLLLATSYTFSEMSFSSTILCS